MKIHRIRDDLDVYHLASEFGPDACLHRIMHLALRHDVKTVVEEQTSASKDYKDEHAGFYAGLFRKIPSKVTRLHFFSKALSLKTTKTSSASSLQKSYIGFCTLRPFKKQRVVEAFLPALQEKDNDSPNKKTFPLCLIDKTVMFGGGKGKKLIAKKTFPFIQQDGNFDCCAHVALRSVNQYLHDKWGGTELAMARIVELAKSVPLAQRDSPTEGLSITQIATIIKEMGFDALVYVYNSTQKTLPFPPERIVYHYIESGLPVLLGIPTETSGHAIVVMGHTFDPDEWSSDAEQAYYGQRRSGGCYHCSTTWVCEFIVSDDNFGPYMTIPKDYLRKVVSQSGLAVVVPIPKDINFRGEDAEIYAHASLSDPVFRACQNALAKTGDSMKWSKLFWDAYDASEVVLRTLLVDSRKVKQGYLAGDYPAKFKDLVKAVKLPSRVWLTEFSLRHLFSQHRKLLGQFITDPTTTPLFGEAADLIIHLPGQLIVRDEKDDRRAFLWNTDHPRQHQYRS